MPGSAFRSPSNTTPGSSQKEYIELLEREIKVLRQQLQQVQNRSNLQTRWPYVEQATYEQALRPRRDSSMALTPANTAPVTVTYYVGDLMEPPFHTATLRLMQFIKANIDPDSWTDSHMMQITEPSISLVITQSRANHDRIADTHNLRMLEL